MDLAIDAYLLGADLGRLGFLGESDEKVKRRCEADLTELSHSLYNLLQMWGNEAVSFSEALNLSADSFVNEWWLAGFNEGKKRYLLKLQ